MKGRAASAASPCQVAVRYDEAGNCMFWNPSGCRIYLNVPTEDPEGKWIVVDPSWRDSLLDKDDWMPVREGAREFLLGMLVAFRLWLNRLLWGRTC